MGANFGAPIVHWQSRIGGDVEALAAARYLFSEVFDLKPASILI
jgi:hypothetical protein